MLVKKFVPRALLQQHRDEKASFLIDIGEVALQMSYFFINPTDVNTVASINTERTELTHWLFYNKNKMKLKEQIKANQITVAVQEALIRNKIFDERGLGEKVGYSHLYGRSYQWIDIPDVRVIYKWKNKMTYDVSSSKVIVRPSSSQFSKLSSHQYYLDELNQAIKTVGNLVLTAPKPDKFGNWNYGLLDLDYNSRLDFSSYSRMLSSLNEVNFEDKVQNNPDLLFFTKDIKATKLGHMLIVAKTGFGKTQLALGISAELGQKGNTIQYFLDPKHSDLSTFGKFLGKGRYADTTEGINEKLHYLVELMKKRYAIMKKMAEVDSKRYVGKSAGSYGFTNIVIVFDEISAHLAADKSCLKDLKQLTMLGRQAGIFVIVIMQDPRSTNNLPATIKDQTTIKVALGELNGTLASLVFGAGVELPQVPRGIGQGFVQFDGGEVELFEAPQMPSNSSDLYELMKQSLKNQRKLDPLRHF